MHLFAILHVLYYLFAILSNYCYIIFICILITLTTYLMYVPNLFLGRLDVLFTNFMMETKKAFNRLYYIYSDIS